MSFNSKMVFRYGKNKVQVAMEVDRGIATFVSTKKTPVRVRVC